MNSSRYIRSVVVSLILYSAQLTAGEKGSHAYKPNVDIVIDSTGNGFLGDGKTDNTIPIQAAIDSCSNAGGGVIEFTNGIFLTGPITLKSNVTFRVDSSVTILGTTNFKAYYPAGYDTTLPMPSSLQPLIYSNHASNITITGSGTIDGNGQPWWTAYNNGTISVRPRLIQLSRSQNILIQNITLQNSPQFHVSLQYCWYAVVQNVTILAPPTSPNTDGIDPATCHFVQILNCKIDNGDDNIAVKSGNYDSSDPNAGTSNITVSGCTFLHGHGLSIGSETNGGVDSMFVTNCTFNGTDNGIRIKSYRGAGGNIRDVSYKNIMMTNVKYPIWFSEYYPTIPASTDLAQPLTTTTPYYHNITIDSLTATDGSTSSPGCIIVGLPETPMKDIILQNVNISGKYGLEVRNASVYTNNTVISASTGSSIIYQVNGSFNVVSFTNGTGGGNWNSPSTWQGYVVPDSTIYVAVMNTDSIIVDQPTKCSSLAILSKGIMNVSAPLSVSDTFAIHDSAFYYNECPGSLSFPSASFYDISNSSYYVHSTNADSVLGSAGYDSTFGNVTILRDGTSSGANLTIKGTLNISNGNLALGQNNLVAAAVNGSSPTNYIVTDGSGVLKIPSIGSVQKIFPVGTLTGFAPVWISNAGPIDTFSVSVNTDTGSTANNDGRVNLRWNINESVPGRSNCTLQFGWMSSAEDTSFAVNRVADARIFYMTDSTDSIEAGTGNYTAQLTTQPFWVSRGGITALGSFGVGDFMLTSVIPRVGGTPYGFKLYQNYPNPFNPSTIISYQLSAISYVTLKVYDVLGRELKTLVNIRQNAGNHKVSFDAGNLSSGVYLYRLVVIRAKQNASPDKFSDMKKLMIVR